MPSCPVHPSLQNAPRSTRRHLNECKPWTGAYDAQGYPRQKVKGKSLYAHRVAFEFFWRKLQPGERVYRRCGDRGCVAYYHVTTERPERQGKRHRPGTAKLTPTKVRNIRRAYAEPGGPTQAELARKYGVSRSCVSCIVRRVTWPDVE